MSSWVMDSFQLSFKTFPLPHRLPSNVLDWVELLNKLITECQCDAVYKCMEITKQFEFILNDI